MFNFSINNIVVESIIDKGLFYIFKFVKEDISIVAGLWKFFFYNCSFLTEWAFTLEIEGAGINVIFFLYVEVINQSILLVSINTSRNWILF